MVVVERVQDLAGEVIGDLAMVAAEATHSRLRVVDSAQPQPGEVQPGRPSLRPLDEPFDVLGVEWDAFALDEERVRLLRREREVARANLAEQAARPQAAEPDRWVGAGRHEE